ncbi:hypothetical protein HDU93_008928 [Gonapodya sp. JEL0774]|nr:hypothetical protein HDU93_008928 [Gonapodya sp. JEL0774]
MEEEDARDDAGARRGCSSPPSHLSNKRSGRVLQLLLSLTELFSATYETTEIAYWHRVTGGFFTEAAILRLTLTKKSSPFEAPQSLKTHFAGALRCNFEADGRLDLVEFGESDSDTMGSSVKESGVRWKEYIPRDVVETIKLTQSLQKRPVYLTPSFSGASTPISPPSPRQWPSLPPPITSERGLPEGTIRILDMADTAWRLLELTKGIKGVATEVELMDTIRRLSRSSALPKVRTPQPSLTLPQQCSEDGSLLLFDKNVESDAAAPPSMSTLTLPSSLPSGSALSDHSRPSSAQNAVLLEEPLSSLNTALRTSPAVSSVVADSVLENVGGSDITGGAPRKGVGPGSISHHVNGAKERKLGSSRRRMMDVEVVIEERGEIVDGTRKLSGNGKSRLSTGTIEEEAIPDDNKLPQSSRKPRRGPRSMSSTSYATRHTEPPPSDGIYPTNNSPHPRSDSQSHAPVIFGASLLLASEEEFDERITSRIPTETTTPEKENLTEIENVDRHNSSPVDHPGSHKLRRGWSHRGASTEESGTDYTIGLRFETDSTGNSSTAGSHSSVRRGVKRSASSRTQETVDGKEDEGVDMGVASRTRKKIGADNNGGATS